MNITLKPEQQQFIQNQLAQGRFPNAEAVINQALELLQEKQREYEDWVEDVRVKVNEAAAELERGEGVSLETVVAEFTCSKNLNPNQIVNDSANLSWTELVYSRAGTRKDDFPSLEEIRSEAGQDILRESL